jgi:hypothetical protein
VQLTFLIIAKILMGFEQGERYDVLERAYKDLNVGVRAMAINFPGTAYHTALKVTDLSQAYTFKYVHSYSSLKALFENEKKVVCRFRLP